MLEVQLKQALEQLTLLGYDQDSSVYYRWLPMKGGSASPQNFSLPLPNYPNQQVEDKALYFVVNGGGHKDAENKEGKCLFADFDDNISEDEVMRRIARVGIPPTLVVKTRHGYHVYWAFDFPIPITDWKKLTSDLIYLVESDPACKNPSRVMRLAGSWHTQKDLQPVQVSIIQDLSTKQKYTYGDLRSAIPQTKTERVEKVNQIAADGWWSLKNFTPYLNYYEENARAGGWSTAQCPHHGGQGHSTDSLHIHEEGQFICHGGCSTKEVWDAAFKLAVDAGYEVPDKSEQQRDELIVDLRKLNDTRDQRLLKLLERDLSKKWGLSRDDLLQLRRAQAIEDAGVSQIPEFLSMSEFWAICDEEEDYFADGLIPNNSFTLLAAEPKIGKTLLCNDIVHGVTKTGTWLGRKVKMGNALIISSDSSLKELRKGMRNRGFSGAEDNIHIMTKFNILDLDALQAKLLEIKPVFVYIDSLRSIIAPAGLDENKAETGVAVGRLKKMLEGFGCTSFLIHHTNKSNGKFSGSGQIESEASNSWLLTHYNPEMEDAGEFKMLCKNRLDQTITRYIKRDTATCVYTEVSKEDMTSPEPMEFVRESKSVKVVRSVMQQAEQATLEEISEYAQITTRTVKEAIKHLMEVGEISEVPTKGNEPNIYQYMRE